MAGERRSFVDNQDGNTVAEALKACASYYSDAQELSIATGYFNLGGFACIEPMLQAAPKVRLLLGTEPLPARRARVPLPGEETIPPSPAELSEQTEASIRIDRDLLGFDPETHNTLRRLASFLQRPEVEVKIYREEFLHGKAFVFGEEAGVIAGSANFTWAGLNQNLELDLGHYDPDKVRLVRSWYDDLWDRAEPLDLLAVFTGRELELDPYTIYLRMLLELYGSELVVGTEGVPDQAGGLTFAQFQKLGISRALRILAEHGGVILADGVGLGKTYMAGGLLQHYEQELGLRAVIVAPAGLRDAVWEKFRVKAGLRAEVISFQELATDLQVGDAPDPGEPDRRREQLKLRADEYRLVVVDEAHALRNPDTRYYHAMRRLMAAGGVNRHLLMLTATPVNNSLWDLYYQIMLFARHDAAFASVGIGYLRDYFREALTLDLEDLAPNHLFPLLDAISVRRTRHHVQKYYSGEVIDTPDGPKEIRFPTPRLHRIDYSLEDLAPGLFADVDDAMQVHDDPGEDRLKMARYQPDAYRLTPTGHADQRVLAGLLRSQLLKRFESSLGAFRGTLRTLIASHDHFLKLLDSGAVAVGEASQEWLRSDLDDVDLPANIEAVEGLEPASLFDVELLRQDVNADRDCLQALLARADSVTPEADPKLAQLVELLAALGTAEGTDNRKVVLFSYYADTILYIRDFLKGLGDQRFEPYSERWTWVTGKTGHEEEPPEDRQKTVWAFVPRSSEAPEAIEERWDLLLTTDILAEGQNLQQCGKVINFDLPWNPMRLVQRNGRVDRIGSPHEEVNLYCFFPAAELDALLRLEERLRDKIAQANASVGIESPALPGTAAVSRNFHDLEEQIRAVADEDVQVIERAEAEVDAFSGEVFREELRRALMAERLDELEKLPWGIGSGMQKATPAAVMFAARIGDEAHWRIADLNASPEGKPVIRTDLLAQLDATRCLPETTRHLPDELKQRLFDLWGQARTDILREYQRRADPAASAAAVSKAQREAVTILQSSDVPGAFEAVAALQVPWPQAVVRAIREILRRSEDGGSEQEIASALINLVRLEGLRAPAATTPPPPIRPEDIHLICYQVVSQ